MMMMMMMRRLVLSVVVVVSDAVAMHIWAIPILFCSTTTVVIPMTMITTELTRNICIVVVVVVTVTVGDDSGNVASRMIVRTERHYENDGVV
jgi:hypothetical protein